MSCVAGHAVVDARLRDCPVCQISQRCRKTKSGVADRAAEMCSVAHRNSICNRTCNTTCMHIKHMWVQRRQASIPARSAASTVAAALDSGTSVSLLPCVRRSGVVLPATGCCCTSVTPLNCCGKRAAATATQLPSLASPLQTELENKCQYPVVLQHVSSQQVAAALSYHVSRCGAEEHSDSASDLV